MERNSDIKLGALLLSRVPSPVPFGMQSKSPAMNLIHVQHR